jgi:hypothetical protein
LPTPVDASRRITTATKSGASPIADRPAAATSIQAAKFRVHFLTRAKPASRRIRPADLKSVDRAAKVFKHFSLSKFTDKKIPENYVDTRKVNDPKAVPPKTVYEVQKALISRQLRKLPRTDPQNSGVTITFPLAKLEEVKKVLPGMGQHGGRVQLDDLLTYLRGRMNGTTFYSSGNPMMKRLTAEVQARSQARAIIERVKKRSGTAQSGATQTAATSKNSPNVRVSRKKRRSKS